MNHLLCFICALTLSQAALPSPLAAAEPVPSSLVSVVLDTDFRPEAQFHIAEALRRPPLDWHMLQEHPSNPAQPIATQEVAADILAAWDKLWKNHPLHAYPADAVASHCEDIWTDLACSRALAEEARALTRRQIDELDLANLPQMNTGEDLMAELLAETAPPAATFPLDPYGYDEYNEYFEPEVYDWFVFVTDDLSVVYVHDISDLPPASSRVATSWETPEYDLAAAAQIAQDLHAEKAVPVAFKTVVREGVRRIVSGDYRAQMLVEQAVAATHAVSEPVWDRYVRRNDLFHHPQLFRTPQVAKLPALLRF